jgi:predicted transcriptional regulator
VCSSDLELILQKLVREINKALMDKNIKKELIFINDFSEYNSWQTIKRRKKLCFFSLKPNTLKLSVIGDYASY